MGWCRICKVDCETVEGLDLHSQTREHQKMAMDMVVTIKQNVKKHKLVPSDHSSLEDTSKPRNASFERRGNKHRVMVVPGKLNCIGLIAVDFVLLVAASLKESFQT